MSSPLASPPEEVASARATSLALFALALLDLIAFANGLVGQFLFDDQSAIVENESIRSLWPLGPVLRDPGASATTVGRPILNLSFASNYAFGGLDPRGFHAVNVVIHVLAAWSLFGVARRTFASAAFAERVRTASTSLAFAVAAIWSVHPLQTSAVTYLCQRAESLAGLFVLLALYCAIRGAAARARASVWSCASVAACALAMATKESAACAPLLVLLHDRTFAAGSFRGALKRRPMLYAGLAATWGVLAVLVLGSESRRGSAGLGLGVSAVQYALTQPGAILEYLRLALWPDPLALDRGARLASGTLEIVPQAAALLLLLIATEWTLVRRPVLGFAGAWFFLALAPSSSFVPLVTQTAAEHRMYLALAPVVALIVVPTYAWLAARGAPRLVARGLAAVVVAALAARTYARNAEYGSPERLWAQSAALDATNVRPHLNLALIAARGGELETAVAHMDVALTIDPDNAYAHLLRGNFLHELKRLDEAFDDYTLAARSRQRAPQALTNRAGLFLESGDSDAALRDLEAALGCDPDYAPAHRMRATVHLLRGEFDSAWKEVEAATRLGQPPSQEFLERLSKASARTD